MGRQFEVRWEGELSASPSEVWAGFTAHTAGWLWKIDYEPRVGGAERGLSGSGGTVTVWDPPNRFVTRAVDGDGANELDYRVEPRGTGSYLRYVHRGVIAGDYERELDACRQHTAFYQHTFGEYLRHFVGRDAAYVSAAGPETSARGGFAALRRALGVGPDVAVGDRIRLTPAGLTPIEGTVDYATPAFLGVRAAEALHRFYGRDAWGWPVGVAHHYFAEGVDEAAEASRWQTWLTAALAATGAVA